MKITVTNGLFTLLLSMAIIVDTAHSESAKEIDPSTSTKNSERESTVWQQTKNGAGKLVDKSNELGAAAIEKSKEIYTEGEAQSSKLLEPTKEAWNNSKEFIGDGYESSKDLGRKALDMAADASSNITDKAQALYDNATKEQAQQPPASVKEL